MMMMMKQSSFGPAMSPALVPGPPMIMDNSRMTPLTPMSMSQLSQQQQQQQQQISIVGPQHPGGSISLGLLIDFIVQRTYHELTVLAELLPRKTDMERKIEVFNFSSRTRLLAVRLLGLVKWASSAAKVDKSVHIMAFLEKQSMLFIETADVLSRMARETLVHARLPNFHIPAAVEVLTTGTYSRLPTCIRERIVPPDPITLAEKRQTLSRLNQVIQHRLVTTELPQQMRNLKIENGRVVFRVENEFQASLTVLGDSMIIPWKLIEIEILVEDSDIGDGMCLVHPLQIHFVHELTQSRIDACGNSGAPLKEMYSVLHSFAQSLQLEVLYSQVLKLCRERLGDYLGIEEYIVGKSIILSYWKELNDPRAELGYRLTISVDTSDSTQPLGITHQPPLSPQETLQTAEGLKSNQLEKIMTTTIYLRSRNRLLELKKELEMLVFETSPGKTKSKCTINQGSPPILSVEILSPCLASELLLIGINTHTGGFLAHVPQFEPSPPVVEEICQVLNAASSSYSKLKGLVSTLRYWITEKRCEKTLQHLPASAAEKIALLKWEEHPILSKIGQHLTIKFQKHPYAILIVEFRERENYEMDYFFYLIIVKKASADEASEDQNLANLGNIGNFMNVTPKFYLRPTSVIPLDTFACTHGPFTTIDESTTTIEKIGLGKRRLKRLADKEEPEKKSKHPSYFVPELAHVVALCDERLPFALLTNELSSRGIVHGGCCVEANGSCLSVPILRLPFTVGSLSESTLEKLHQKLEYAHVRSQMQLRGFRTWNFELKFSSVVAHQSIPGADKSVHFVTEMSMSGDDHVGRIVEHFLEEWYAIAHLFHLIVMSGWLQKLEKIGAVAIKSFTWNKLVLSYGPNRAAIVTIFYSLQDRAYKLSFGGNISHNPHTLMRIQLEHFINSVGSLEALVKTLNDTYEPLYSLTKLPSTPQLGAQHNRPQIPVQTFILVPQSPTRVRVIYNSIYCLDVLFQGEGLVSVRDGAFSRFDNSHVLGELTPSQGLKAFLSKYVDENAVFRRRSQSEDDNPPSPMQMDNEMIATPSTNNTNTSSPFTLGNKPQSPAPGRSNPHTPASPHISQSGTGTGQQSQTQSGFSPAASFANLASPPSLLSQQSPNPSGANIQSQQQVPAPSPSSNIPAPSPSQGPLSVPAPSPGQPGSHHQNPASVPPAGSVLAQTLAGQSHQSHPSPFFHADSSPAGVHSPWGAVGSPGINQPRPSPMRVGHSPQGSSGDHLGSGILRSNLPSRVLPPKPYAGAIPTILTHDALDVLCTPVTSLENSNDNSQQSNNNNTGYPCSPMERFLGCSYLRKQLQRIVQTEEHLQLLTQEPGVLIFRAETMHFRVGLDSSHFQSLHIKISPVAEGQQSWGPDELSLLESFFATKVVSPPFRPNGLAAFARMVSLPPRIIRDCLQIIRLELIPSIVEQQGWRWSVQLCLTVPPSAMPIIPVGQAAIVTSASKILIYLHLTKIQSPLEKQASEEMDTSVLMDQDKIPFIVVPLIHEITTNTTQLAEKRAMGPPSMEYAAISGQLKRFAEFHHGNVMECSIFPAVQDLLANLNLSMDTGPQGPSQLNPVGPMVRPSMGPGGPNI